MHRALASPECDDLERLTDYVLMNDVEAIRRIFQGSSVPCPNVEWSPDFRDLAAPELRRLADYWSGLASGTSPPPAFSVSKLGDAQRYVMLIDVMRGGDDFFYQFYGQGIAEVTGFDMTGKLLSTVPTDSTLAAFFVASYRAVVLSRAPLVTHHYPPYAVRWTRLILPLAGDDGLITRLIVGNVPDMRLKRTV